eukprot:COSAG02_NODE_68882_length_215_cov_4.146552_1_plen_49_part_10
MRADWHRNNVSGAIDLVVREVSAVEEMQSWKSFGIFEQSVRGLRIQTRS